MKILRHIVIVVAALFLILGIPFLRSDAFSKLTGSSTDAVSSASLIIDQPSGNYQVYINTEKHPDQEKLDTWVAFFEGKEISYIFEDITCMVAEGDSLGLEMAQSFQSRLPENQMTIRQVDPTLMLSKAEHGRYDIMILSKEIADMYGAGTVSTWEDTLDLSVTQSE